MHDIEHQNVILFLLKITVIILEHVYNWVTLARLSIIKYTLLRMIIIDLEKNAIWNLINVLVLYLNMGFNYYNYET